MNAQLRFDLGAQPTFRRETFVVSPSNAAAAAALDAWPDWLGGALALVGPEGSGKSHLASVWAEESSAIGLTAQALGRTDLAALGNSPVLVDGVEGADDEALFHLLNRAAAGGGALLLTARQRPTAWLSALPDLRSRLNALQVAEIGEPDDALLTAVLAKFLAERDIIPLDGVLSYLAFRLERSVLHARAAADQLDRRMSLRQRTLSKVRAREILDLADPQGELFDADEP